MITIWILVYTVGGLLTEPEIFFDKKDALYRKRRLKMGNGLKDYDDLEIYSKRLKITG